MLYGASGMTKTTQLYFMAKWLLSLNPGKILRMILSDAGGIAPFLDSGMIERGEVEIMDFSNRKNPFADYRRLSEGYWPRWELDGKIYATYQPNSNVYFTGQDICRTKPEEWPNIIGYLNDGMSALGNVLINHCSTVVGEVGFKKAWEYEEDGYTITGLQMGHYGMVQKEFYDRHNRGFNSLPVQWLIYTALVGKGDDKMQKEAVYGPQLVGNASTPSVPTWFMDCFHLSKEKYVDVVTPLTPNAKGKEVEKIVAWFQQHVDANTGISYLAKCRVMPEKVPDLMKYFPYGFVPMGYKQGIDLYYKVLEKLNKEK